MTETSEAAFRLRLADGFIGEARQDLELQRWRSCVDNSQLAVENAAKAVLALLGPTGRTHNPGPLIREFLESGAFDDADRQGIETIVQYAELLGPDIHIRSDYGDEAGGLTPWELFGAIDAREALTWADDAVRLARMLVHPDPPAAAGDAPAG
jgi:HEPN domain-containing protein